MSQWSIPDLIIQESVANPKNARENTMMQSHRSERAEDCQTPTMKPYERQSLTQEKCRKKDRRIDVVNEESSE